MHNDKTSKVTFDGEPKNWPDFKWKVQHKFRRLGIVEALREPKYDVRDVYVQRSSHRESKAKREFKKAYTKGDEFLYDALTGRAIRLVKDVEPGNLAELWITLSGFFEGSGTRTIATLLRQVDQVTVGSTLHSRCYCKVQ